MTGKDNEQLKGTGSQSLRKTLAEAGYDRADLMNMISEARKHDVDWHHGKLFGIVYFLDEELLQLATDVYGAFMSESASKPQLWPSLNKFETEIVDMVLHLFHGDAATVGTFTSGGTESIFLAVKAARDWARSNRAVTGIPEIIAPRTAHPAFDKAAHYLCCNVIRVPLCSDFRADVSVMKAAITPNTMMIVGSAPGYPHGVIDPIAELGALAEEQGLWFHVDACHGFLAPFVKKLGFRIPDLDFSVSGVTTISVDLHKWGFAPKGASLVLYRSLEFQNFQGFDFNKWPAGRYRSTNFTGTRPGSGVAAAWAVMNYLGERGYLRIAETVMETKQVLIEGIRAINGLEIIGNAELGIVTFGSHSFDVLAVADAMMNRSWITARTSEPPALHLVVMPIHLQTASAFLSDLADVVKEVKAGKSTGGRKGFEY